MVPCYRLLTFTCSTHAANLVVRSAITHDGRGRHADPDHQPLVANRVRFFKYLMPEYASDFVVRLRDYIDSNIRFMSEPPAQNLTSIGVGCKSCVANAFCLTACARS